MTEVWKSLDFIGFPNYAVSNYGRIKSLGNAKTRKEKILKPRVTKGYYFVTLCKNGKRKNYLSHRLAAEAFIENPNNLPCVNHKNEFKWCNCIWNLEWCSHEYNNNYGAHKKRLSESLKGNPLLGAHKKAVICLETGVIYQSAKDASELLLISQGNICSCCNGKLKTAGGYHWEYIERFNIC